MEELKVKKKQDIKPKENEESPEQRKLTVHQEYQKSNDSVQTLQKILVPSVQTNLLEINDQILEEGAKSLLSQY